MRTTRRNSVTAGVGAGAGTPSKNPMPHLTKTSDVITPRKVGRPRNAVPELKEEVVEVGTPTRRVTRSQSISPPNSDLLIVKTRGKKTSPNVEDLMEVEEESNTNTEKQQKNSPKKRLISENSKSVCFNESIISEAEKTVYPKTPLHLKSTNVTKENMNDENSHDAGCSFNELFGESNRKSHMPNDSVEIEDDMAFNESKSSESKISSTPKITQKVQILLKKVDDDLFRKQMDMEIDESTPVKKVENLNEIVEISSDERAKTKSFSKSFVEEVEMKSPKTPTEEEETSKPDDMVMDSAEKSLNLLIDSIVNEDGKVDCSQKRISLRYEKLQESLLLHEQKSRSTDTSLKNMSLDDAHNESTSRKSINLSKLKEESKEETINLNKSMPDKKSAEITDKGKNSRYSASNLDEVEMKTIPLAFENDDATEPKEITIVEKTPVKNSEKLSKSFNDLIKEKKSAKKERHSMAEIIFTQVKETLINEENEETEDEFPSHNTSSSSTKKLNKSKTKEEKCSEIEEKNEKLQAEEEKTNENKNYETKLDDNNQEEKNVNTLGSWSSMNVYGRSNQKIDGIKFDDHKPSNELVDELEIESIGTIATKRRRSRKPVIESSDEEEDEEANDSEEVELAEDEKPYKFNAFASGSAMEAEESYESGDSLESELEELIQENEIPTHAEDLGSEDTDVSEPDEEEDDDSFIASDNEEELLDYDDYDEGIKLGEKKHKRVFVFSSDSSDEDEKKTDVKKSSIKKRNNCISSDESEDETNEKPLENEANEEKEVNEENVPMIIIAQETTIYNSSRSLNNTQLGAENDLIEIEEKDETATKLNDDVMENAEENNESLNLSKISLKQHGMESAENSKDEPNGSSIKKLKKRDTVFELESEVQETAIHEEMQRENRKRKRKSQSFCENTSDNETVHKHKKTKLNEITAKTAIVFEEDQSKECSEAKCEEELNAKQQQNSKKSPKGKKVKSIDLNEENSAVDTQMECEELEGLKPNEYSGKDSKDVYSRVLKTASNKLNPFEEKIKSKQLSEDVLKAIFKLDAPVKQKKPVKKNKKHSSRTVSGNKLVTSAGEVRVIPSTPPIDIIETIEMATGIVRVEPVTPKLTQKAGVLRESPVTPFSIGFRVRKLMGEQHQLPECPNKNRVKKRKLALDVEEPSSRILQPQWTTSGVFKVENKHKGASKKVLITSNDNMKHISQSKAGDAHFGASENALKFKMNVMSKNKVPTESSSKILQRKKRQQVQQRF